MFFSTFFFPPWIVMLPLVFESWHKDKDAAIISRMGVDAYRCAGLDEELAHGSAVVHGVERSDLVDSHGGHLEQAGDLVHDADAGEAVLALAEVQKGHDGGLLVLGGVSLEDLGHELLILGVELEGDVGVAIFTHMQKYQKEDIKEMV